MLLLLNIFALLELVQHTHTRVMGIIAIPGVIRQNDAVIHFLHTFSTSQ